MIVKAEVQPDRVTRLEAAWGGFACRQLPIAGTPNLIPHRLASKSLPLKPIRGYFRPNRPRRGRWHVSRARTSTIEHCQIPLMSDAWSGDQEIVIGDRDEPVLPVPATRLPGAPQSIAVCKAVSPACSLRAARFNTSRPWRAGMIRKPARPAHHPVRDGKSFKLNPVCLDCPIDYVLVYRASFRG